MEVDMVPVRRPEVLLERYSQIVVVLVLSKWPQELVALAEGVEWGQDQVRGGPKAGW
jgi:hypothetical protein